MPLPVRSTISREHPRPPLNCPLPALTCGLSTSMFRTSVAERPKMASPASPNAVRDCLAVWSQADRDTWEE